MKAITIKQPWAWLIVTGIKDIENRSRKTKFRGTVLIHAGKLVDKVAYHSLIKQQIGLPEIERLQCGGIIGKVDIVDCVKEHDSSWFYGPWGWVLKNPFPVTFITMKGQQSFFETGLSIDDSEVGRETIETGFVKLEEIGDPQISNLTGLKKKVADFVSELGSDSFISDRDLRKMFKEKESGWDSVLRSSALRKFRTRDKARAIWWGHPKELHKIEGPKEVEIGD